MEETRDGFMLEYIGHGDGGKRLWYEGDVFEAYQVDDSDVRVYREGNNWHAKIHLADVREKKEAFEAVNTAATRINDAYDTALSVDAVTFQEETDWEDTSRRREKSSYHRSYTLKDRPFTIDFTAYKTIRSRVRCRDLPTSAKGKWALGNWTAKLGAIPSGAAGGSAAAAAMGADPATAGALLAGGLAAGAGYSLLVEPIVNGTSGKPTVSRITVDRLVSGTEAKYSLDNEDFLDRLGRKYELEQKAEQGLDRDWADAEAWEDIDGDELDTKWKTLRRLQFEEFEETHGVTVSMDADDYMDVKDFVETMTGGEIEIGEEERPLLQEDMLHKE